MTTKAEMPNPTVLVLWASTHGHTEKIASRIADVLRGQGIEVDVRRAGQRADPSPEDYDGVVIAASVHRAAHQREVVHYAERHRTLLSTRPSAFVSVSLTAADDDAESHEATRRMIDEFLDATGWIPGTVVAVAGALQYREYDFVTRLLMRLTTRGRAGTGDIGRDHEYTDWDAVEEFARAFASKLEPAAARYG